MSRPAVGEREPKNTRNQNYQDNMGEFVINESLEYGDGVLPKDPHSILDLDIAEKVVNS